MSSVAFNLSRKLEWMARRIRHIDNGVKLIEWIAAMTAINKLLNEIDTTKVYRDEWTPWPHGKKSEKVLKMDVDEVEPAKGEMTTQEVLMPSLRPLRGKSGIKERDGIKLKGGKKLKEEKKEVDGDEPHRTDPKAAVMEMLKKAEPEGRRALRMSVPSEAIAIGKSWREELHRRLNDDGYKGCAYQGKLGEWHPTEELLKDIAAVIYRDGKNDLLHTFLRKVLFSDTIKFFKNSEALENAQ